MSAFHSLQYPASRPPLHWYHQLEATCSEVLQSPSPLPVNAWSKLLAPRSACLMATKWHQLLMTPPYPWMEGITTAPHQSLTELEGSPLNSGLKSRITKHCLCLTPFTSVSGLHLHCSSKKTTQCVIILHESLCNHHACECNGSFEFANNGYYYY